MSATTGRSAAGRRRPPSTIDPGTPDDDRSIDPLPTSDDTVCINHLDGGVKADFDAQAFKSCLKEVVIAPIDQDNVNWGIA
jgi:hypothetical protein